MREHLLQKAQPDVKQFLVKDNKLKFIKEASLKVKLKAVEEDEEKEEKKGKEVFKPPYLDSDKDEKKEDELDEELE